MLMEDIPLCLVLNKLAHLLSWAQNRFSLIVRLRVHVDPTGEIILTIDSKPYVCTIWIKINILRKIGKVVSAHST